MTLGAEFSIKRMGNNVIQIWDLAGQPTFSAVRKSYYVGGVGALILYDITNRDSYDNVIRWAEEIITNTGYPVPLMIVGNKIDLRDAHPNSVTTEEGVKLARQLQEFLNCPISYTGASAKTGLYVDGIFEYFINWSTSTGEQEDGLGVTIRSIPEYNIETKLDGVESKTFSLDESTPLVKTDKERPFVPPIQLETSKEPNLPIHVTKPEKEKIPPKIPKNIKKGSIPQIHREKKPSQVELKKPQVGTSEKSELHEAVTDSPNREGQETEQIKNSEEAEAQGDSDKKTQNEEKDDSLSRNPTQSQITQNNEENEG